MRSEKQVMYLLQYLVKSQLQEASDRSGKAVLQEKSGFILLLVLLLLFEATSSSTSDRSRFRDN